MYLAGRVRRPTSQRLTLTKGFSVVDIHSQLGLYLRTMIICVCRRLNEKAVREAVRAGAGCGDTVQAHHGCAFNCGKCREVMEDVVECEKRQLTEGAHLIAAE